MLQDGQVTDAPRSALLHPKAACLTSGTHEVIVSAFEMHLQLLGAEHLTDDAKFWETEPRFDTMEVHKHRFLTSGGISFQNFARNPVLVNKRLSAPCYRPQTLASNLAKSHTMECGFFHEKKLYVNSKPYSVVCLVMNFKVF
jgi:hypothetical protein